MNAPEGKGLSSTVPVENYPCLLVKGEVDPAIIHGKIEYAYNHWVESLRFKPIQVPGRVRAVGIAEDPITGRTYWKACRGYRIFQCKRERPL